MRKKYPLWSDKSIKWFIDDMVKREKTLAALNANTNISYMLRDAPSDMYGNGQVDVTYCDSDQSRDLLPLLQKAVGGRKTKNGFLRVQVQGLSFNDQKERFRQRLLDYGVKPELFSY